MSSTSAPPGFAFYASRMVRLWRAEINRRLAKYGLTESRWLTLFHLKKLGEQATQTELADSVGVKGPTMVKTLDWLEAQQFIERCSLAADRRTKIIRFRDKGDDIFEEIHDIVINLRHELIADIPETDLATSLNVIHAISIKLTTLQSPHRAE